MSITETYVAGLVDKFNISRTKAVLFGGGLSAIISLVYATQGGMIFLDNVDYFINQFGVAMLGLIEIVLIAWVFRKVGEYKAHANAISDIRLGWWWTVSLTVITPIVLGYMMYGLLKTNLLKQFDTPTGNYEGYSDSLILYSGWSVAIVVVIGAFIISAMKWRANHSDMPADEKEEA